MGLSRIEIIDEVKGWATEHLELITNIGKTELEKRTAYCKTVRLKTLEKVALIEMEKMVNIRRTIVAELDKIHEQQTEEDHYTYEGTTECTENINKINKLMEQELNYFIQEDELASEYIKTSTIEEMWFYYLNVTLETLRDIYYKELGPEEQEKDFYKRQFNGWRWW